MTTEIYKEENGGLLDRAYGALVGGAIGDAMGMPASFLTRAQIEKSYGYIQDFLEPEKDVQSYHGDLQAAEITDDTMESVIISDLLIRDGKFTEAAFNEAMKKWAVEQKMLESTVIGPSTRRYLTAIIEGRDPKETSGLGNTNGSAMRVAPIGVKYHFDLSKCIEAAAASSMPSHGSKPAVAAACAVAAAVAAGVAGGSSPLDVLRIACEAAEYGEKKALRLRRRLFPGASAWRNLSWIRREIQISEISSMSWWASSAPACLHTNRFRWLWAFFTRSTEMHGTAFWQPSTRGTTRIPTERSAAISAGPFPERRRFLRNGASACRRRAAWI